VLKALSTNNDPQDTRQRAAERAAYRKVLQEAGMFAKLADHGPLRFTIDELLDLAPLKFDAMTPDERRRWGNSLDLAGRDIPYHPSWRRSYPEVVATYPYKQLLELLDRDVERWELAYPFFFSGHDGGRLLIQQTLAAAKDAKLDRMLKQAEAYHASLLEQAQWLASRPGDATEAAPEPARHLLYFTEEIPGWKQEPAVEWAGSKIDLVEIAYGLLEAGILKATNGRGKAIEALAAMFNLVLGKPERHLQTIKKRPLDSEQAQALDRAKQALVHFLIKNKS
jgi:hypothetical protein